MSQSPVLSTRDEIAKLQEEYAKNPEGRLFVHLAEAYRKSGELERARDLLLQGLQNHADYVSARIVLAEVQGELGADEEAQEAWEKVLELDGESEVALRGLAELAARGGRAEDAIAHYELLLEICGDDPEVRERIAELRGGDATAGRGGKGGKAKPTANAGTPDPGKSAAADAPAEESSAEAAAAVKREEPRTAAREESSRSAAQRREPPKPQTDAIGLSELLVRLLEYRDSTFNAESSLTRLLAVAIGRELELEQAHLEALSLAALLSDIGGAGLGDPAGAAPVAGSESPESRRSEQREVAISLQLLQGLTLPAGVHEAIRHQHERWDGSGYPDGLRDEEIPYGARVLAIARAAAELLTDRSAGRTRPAAAALDELQRHAGSRFDPVVINVLRRVFQHRADHGIGYGLGGHVMIVHPQELRVLGLATQLHASGYVAEMSFETARVRERLRAEPTKAIVLAADLPGSDVARFIQEVRGSARGSSIPVIVIDANDMDRRVDLLTAGADVCFPSEVTFREFKATLDALLRRTEEAVELGHRGAEVQA